MVSTFGSSLLDRGHMKYIYNTRTSQLYEVETSNPYRTIPKVITVAMRVVE